MTPTLRRLTDERNARLQRLAAKAVPDTPVECISASARSERAIARKKSKLSDLNLRERKEWARRQIERFKLPEVKKVWFSFDDQPSEPAVKTIQQVVCDYYLVSLRDLLSPRRTDSIVRPRQIAMYLSHEMTTKSYPELGRRFGGRDHTTVLHGVRKIATLRHHDPLLASEINELTKLLEIPREEARANSLDLCPSEAQEPSGPDQRASQPPGERAPVLGQAE